MTATETLGLILGLAIVTAALVWTAHLRPPAMVTAAVALVTLGILAAWVADPERADSLVPLLGVGLGGMVGALTNLFQPPEPRGNKEDEDA